MIYSNSSLVTYVNLSPNKTSIKNKINDTISIHCIVGQWTAKQGADYFAKPSAKSSANYIIGKDGSISLGVEEKDRAWTTGGTLTVNGQTGAMNDRHAITIEVASDTKPPYAITDAAYTALVKLVADIAKRNNMGELKWKADKNLIGHPELQNITVHRWFAHKTCPGDYIYERLGNIANEANMINAAAGYPAGQEEEEMTKEQFKEMLKECLDDMAKEESTWEEGAMTWAQKEGLMQGDENGNIMPKKFMTRGEFATVLQRYDSKH